MKSDQADNDDGENYDNDFFGQEGKGKKGTGNLGKKRKTKNKKKGFRVFQELCEIVYLFITATSVLVLALPSY